MNDATSKVYLDLCNVLSFLGHDVRIFVMSETNGESKLDVYPLYSIRGYVYPDHTSPVKYLDFATLILFKRRPLMWLMNRSAHKLFQRVDKFAPDVIVIGDYILADALSRYLKSKKDKIKIVSIMDSPAAVRNALAGYGGIINLLLKDRYIDWGMDKYRLMCRLSHIVTSSPNALKEIQIEIPLAQVTDICPYYVDDIETSKSKQVKSILFIGSYKHAPNREGINNILEKIAPKIPEVVFWIAGKDCPKQTIKNVHFLGEVDDPSELIRRADLCIAPITSGSGRKAKMFDYLSKGKVVIGTSLALDGFGLQDNYDAIIEDDLDKYAGRIRAITPQHLKLMQKNVPKVIKKYTKRVIAEEWRNVIE